MKDLIVDISLYNKKIGAAYWDGKNDCCIFEYDPKFISSGLEVAPLIMPLQKSRQIPYSFTENRNKCFSGLPGLLADSLPDKYGAEKIDAYFASKGIPDEEITPLDRLCYIGKRGMGALEFEPSDSYKELDESTSLNIKEIVDIAQEIFNNRAGFQDMLRQKDKRIIDILKVGTSAGGAKPKAIIAYNEKTEEVRSGQVKAPEGFGYWLLKFDGGKFLENEQICDNPKGIGQIEYAYYLMAKECRIDMNECRLLEEGDNHHFMTRRFDRTDKGDKIHMQTLAAIAHYNRDERHSYEQIFEVMRKMNLHYKEQEQMFRRMVFNVATRNHDDHTKNHSFLMDTNGKWRLAPAYDLCYSYNPKGKYTKGHQMYLNGKKADFDFEDLKAVADKIGINKGTEIINEIMDVACSWKEFAEKAGVNKFYANEIERNIIILKSPTISLRK
ncbi:MAG: type II toxin-antitoxin system HipA family toxin [Prevotella sp.]|nr:type II toxin-antitoxin system HipA family toxin [Prevotella sp.]